MQIRKALIDDLDAIKAIADANKNELGFVLRPVLAESIQRKEVLVATNHSEVVGFVEFRHRKDSQTTLYHIAVDIGLRRQKIGQALLDALCEEASSLDKEYIQLKCPQELAANSFYESYGFTLISIQNGKKRPLNIWVLPLD